MIIQGETMDVREGFGENVAVSMLSKRLVGKKL